MIENILNVLGIVIIASITLCSAFVLIRVCYLIGKEADFTPVKPPQSETPVKPRKPRNKKQS